MSEALIALAILLAAIAAVFSFMCFRRLRATASPEALTRDVVTQLVRSECELVRKAAEDQSRGLRQELADSLRGFQDGTLNAFGTLSEAIRAQVQEFGARLDAGTQTIDKRVEGIATKLNDDLGRMGSEAHANRDALRQVIESKLDDAGSKQSEASIQLRQDLDSSFRRMSERVAEALQQASEQQRERLAGTTVALTALGEKQEQAQEKLRQAVEGRLDAIRSESASKLEEMRLTVDEKLQSTLETRLGESFNRVVEHLNRVYEGIGEMKKLAANVGDLQKVLTNVKVRGTYGEVQLALLLEEFLSPEQFVKNAAVKEHSSERVEFAIRMPGRNDGVDVLLPVDAKFPREDYEKLVAASEEGDAKLVAMFRKQLENRIRGCAKDIHDKYICPPATTEFGILFIPTESLYAEILRQPGFFESIQREYRVTLASPTTFTALLNALQMGFRSLAIEKRSSEVWKVLGAVRTEFNKYNTVVDRLGKQISQAANSVESLGTRTRAMTRKLKTVEALPDDSTAQKLLGLTPDEIDAGDDEVEIRIPTTLARAN